MLAFVARLAVSARSVCILVWCPKYRRRLLAGRVATRLNELLDEVAADNDWQIVAREVMPDHVHIFVRIRPTHGPAALRRRHLGHRFMAWP